MQTKKAINMAFSFLLNNKNEKNLELIIHRQAYRSTRPVFLPYPVLIHPDRVPFYKFGSGEFTVYILVHKEGIRAVQYILDRQLHPEPLTELVTCCKVQDIP